MLSKQQNGWTDFKLNRYMYGLSYLTNVPIDWLDKAIHGLETMQPFVVHGELEPRRMLCIVSYWNCYIFVEDEENIETKPRDDVECEIANINMIDFCKMLYDDISSDIEGWHYWPCTGINKRSVIKRKLARLKKLLKKREKCLKYDENGVLFYF